MDDLTRDIPDADVLVVGNRAFTLEVANAIKQHAQRLSWVQFTTSGIDNARTFGLPKGVTVTNAAGLRAFSVAEHALALLLALIRQLRTLEDAQRRETWVRDAVTPSMDNLAGKRLAIIGAGAIGQEIARKAKAFDMQVTGVTRAPGPIAHFDAILSREQMKQAVEQADVVVMAANYDDDTHGMFDAGVIAAMTPKAYFINIARGKLVDEEALVEALRSRRIAGAGLDVTTVEPVPAGYPLFTLPNVILSPHVGGAGSEGTGAGMGKILADNLQRWLSGEPLKGIVLQT